MIPAMVTVVIATALIIGVGVLAAWLDHPKESWYDKHLKRMWKDTKDDQGDS